MSQKRRCRFVLTCSVDNVQKIFGFKAADYADERGLAFNLRKSALIRG